MPQPGHPAAAGSSSRTLPDVLDQDGPHGFPENLIFRRVATIALAFDVDVRTVRRWAAKGELRLQQKDGVTVASLSDIRTFVERHFKPLGA